MGAVAGEELRKMEKIQAPTPREEKILVLVRLRPLNEKEISGNEVADWECINDTTILYRNTLREGSTFPSAYTFDRVFRGDCSTKQVYEEGAKEIALSAVNGVNSSIFAYGQTSSGKTYTMTGITEYTVADIFDYVHRHEERAFVLKFSAIEIYNEAIRDLLSSENTSLRLLDDPEKGTVVEKVTEETLRDWNHLQELLSACEAQRRIGETSLNERSSRSHQIIRLTIESSAREFLGKENSTSLSAIVNFIDLAGSERASQALSTGTRLKEGCHINRSLLTLSTVIRKLSKGRQGHINYRDSKLTRLLQPCLGGNARTAIICTLSPARSHVEQTRNTLLFACCAKEVTTKAQVNVVMSDKALVKHLQKELARLESELRSPAPTSASYDYTALLRKKDLQIQKMEKEIKDLTKQRDLAQSRVDDLLRVIANTEDSIQESGNNHQANNTWEDDYSVSVSSGDKKLNQTQYSNTESVTNSEDLYHQENAEDPYLSDGTSTPLSIRKKFGTSDPGKSPEENSVGTAEDPNVYCKEVQCIEMEESGRVGNSESHALSNGVATDQQMVANPVNGERQESRMQNGFTYHALDERLHNVQRTIDSLASPHAEPGESSQPSMEKTDQIDSTPPNGMEKNFPGRPHSVRRRFPFFNYGDNNATLSRNNSQSSLDSEAQSIRTTADITSIHTFVAGLKKMAENQVQETDLKTDGPDKTVKDVGLDPMHEAMGTLNWPVEFEKQQRTILELWQTCNVSLIHRTYFFLLFKGDPSDSIYMEVELRRLSFLKESFSNGNRAVEDGRTLTLASSVKALCREKEMLSKLMRRRLSEEERTALFKKWGIALDSKRRRLQLANQLWSNTKDMNHISESAAIVATLVRFVGQGQALKEMFGLSFTPATTRRRSFGRKLSMATLL